MYMHIVGKTRIVGLAEMKIPGPGAFNSAVGEFILNHSDVLKSRDPQMIVTDFLQNTYGAATPAAGWNRANLDRDDAFVAQTRDAK
jgi:Family of unknown function (DUF5996)